jgi:hypothetical protein
LLFNRFREQVSAFIERLPATITAGPPNPYAPGPGEYTRCPSDQADSDHHYRCGERPERGQIAAMRRSPHKQHKPERASSDHGHRDDWPQEASFLHHRQESDTND